MKREQPATSGRSAAARLADQRTAPDHPAPSHAASIHASANHTPAKRLAPSTRHADASSALDPDSSASSDLASDSGLLRRFRGQIAREIGPEAFARYFDGQIDMRLDDRRLSIAAPTRFLASMIERRFGDVLRGAASSIPGMDNLAIEVAANDERSARTGDSPSAGAEITAANRKRNPDDAAERTEKGRDAAPGSRRGNRTATSDATRESDTRAVISDRYRLEDFIVGESNRLAYDAAMRLAESDAPDSDERAKSLPPGAPLRARPLRSFGPLFIHGACGMGKTHLLQGVALRFKQRRPGAIVRFITGEAFTNEFLAALHGSEFGKAAPTPSPRAASNGPSSNGKSARDSMERFRKRYRRVDLLCIDDIHFLASKSATQAELLHTFNELELGGAQIVLACDEHPRHVKKFSDALISRFMSGMVARVDPPDRELCEKIIRRFAERRGLIFDHAALRALSANISALGDRSPSAPTTAATKGLSIREIEGLVTRIEAFMRLTGGARPDAPLQITTATLRQVMAGGSTSPGLRDEARSAGMSGRRAQPLASVPHTNNGLEHPSISPEGKPVRLESIMSETCRLLGVEHSDLTGSGRHPRVVLARSIIGHLARRLTRLSFPEIARGMGRPSHSTIIAACQRLEKQLVGADAPAPIVPGLDLTVAEVCDRLANSLVARSN